MLGYTYEWYHNDNDDIEMHRDSKRVKLIADKLQKIADLSSVIKTIPYLRGTRGRVQFSISALTAPVIKPLYASTDDETTVTTFYSMTIGNKFGIASIHINDVEKAIIVRIMGEFEPLNVSMDYSSSVKILKFNYPNIVWSRDSSDAYLLTSFPEELVAIEPETSSILNLFCDYIIEVYNKPVD